MTEALALFSSPAALVLLLASAICIRFRSQIGTLIVVLLWTTLVSLVAFRAPDESRLAAIGEGCIGSPTLFIAAVAAICGGMILYTSRQRERDKLGD